MSYAGFWKRFAAVLIDTIIIGCVVVLVSMILGIGLVSSFLAADVEFMSEEEAPAVAAGMISSIVLFIFIMFIGQWLYFALMESSPKQATLGKMALGIIVTDMNGNRISFGRATGRHFGKILSGIILYVGYMMAGWTEKKQALHDIIAGCLVVNK